MVGDSPFETFGWLGLWVLLVVLLVFGLCLGFQVWAHGFGMSDGLVCGLVYGRHSCDIKNGGGFPLHNLCASTDWYTNMYAYLYVCGKPSSNT